MRVGCVLATHLRAKVEMSRASPLGGQPGFDRRGAIRRRRGLWWSITSPPRSGVKEGITLEAAMSHHADAVVLDADEPCYRRAFHRMVADLQQGERPGGGG